MPVKGESGNMWQNGQMLQTEQDTSLLMTAFGNGQSLEIYQELILRHLIQDINQRCDKLGIPTEPNMWIAGEAKLWLADVAQKLDLDLPIPHELYFSGPYLCTLTQQELLAKFPTAGDRIYAQLQIWKTAIEFEKELKKQKEKIEIPSECRVSPTVTLSLPTSSPESTTSEVQLQLPTVQQTMYALPSPVSEDNSEDYDRQSASQSGSNWIDRNQLPPPTHNGTIHLWEFIREQLDNPETSQNCVRWLNRDNGTFKIEDSDRLSQLWGKRKNRLKMNYDKLSRSLRQYYKKNIIRKTGLRQRLIYQFVPPFPYF